jgi:hypothetical protein
VIDRDEILPMFESGESYKAIGEALGWSQTNVRYWARLHGLKRERSYARKYTDDQMRAFVEGCSSVSQVVRAMGISMTGGNHRAVTTRLREMEISFGSGPTTKGRAATNRKTPDQILVCLSPNSPRTRPDVLRRALDEIGVLLKCATCGQSDEWMGKPLTLEVDHVDGDAMNNQRKNLRFGCPNCHSQTDTYGSKNIARLAQR